MPSLRWLKRHGAMETPSQMLKALSVKLIAGLGNPGTRYANSRHNIGFKVVEAFARAHATRFARKRFNAEIAEATLAENKLLIVKPQTFMNASGEAVGKLYAFYKIAPTDLLVIYDDLDLPLGKIRLRADGSAGGHHGMESIIARVGTSNYARLRIGIGRPDPFGRLRASPDADIDHVLGNFSDDERAAVDETIARAVEAIEVWLKDGIVVAMNRFN